MDVVQRLDRALNDIADYGRWIVGMGRRPRVEAMGNIVGKERKSGSEW